MAQRTRRVRTRSTARVATARVATARVATAALLVLGVPVGVASAQQSGNPFALTAPSPCDQLLAAFKADAKAALAPVLAVPAPGAVPANAPATTAAPAVAANPVGQPTTGVPKAGRAKRKASVNRGGSSGTNTQESGVDEGDLVENDGRYVYAVDGTELRIVDTTTRRLVSSLGIGDALGSEPQLIRTGKRLVIVSQVEAAQRTRPAVVGAVDPTQYGAVATHVTVLDISRPSRPRVVRSTTVDGSVSSIRATGNIVRLVMSSSSALPVIPYSGDSQHDVQARSANEAIIDSSTIDQWLPRVASSLGAGAEQTRPALGCDRIWRPELKADQQSRGYSTPISITWLASLDMSATGELVGSAGLLPGPDVDGGPVIGYSSEDSLFVAAPAADAMSTVVHQFRFDRSTIADYVGSGSVPGLPLNSYALDHVGNTLRIATTERTNGLVSGVRILRTGQPQLAEIGYVGDLGRGEQIRSVRFLHATAYVVTFRRTDPLYVIDLREPTNPRVTGELKINGYSAYLYPLGPQRLLGVGQDATGTGRTVGLQVSLFDVSDPTQPKRIDALQLGGNSEVEQDYHAFLYWARTGDAAIPAADGFSSTLSMVRVRGDSLVRRADVQQQVSSLETPPGIRRAMVVAGRLVTVSASGVQINDLGSLRRLGFVPFSV
jgi:uncharacterized secreted protein with C-terminal beta-propeller domain